MAQSGAFAALESARRTGLTGAGVLIGHLDTGLAGDHPALAGRIAAFRHFDRGGDPIPGALPHDSAAHGTQTASLICGVPVEGIATGIAPAAKLVSGAVIEGGDVLARIVAGVDWLLDHRVRAVCLALGVRRWTPLFRPLLAALREAGSLPVLPAGNGGAGSLYCPAEDPLALTVGAAGAADRVARFSGSRVDAVGRQSRHKPDVLAPGQDLEVAVPGGFTTVSGTSHAAAVAAGIAALLFEARPRASVDQVEEALLASAGPVPEEQSHRTFRGVLDPTAALARLDESTEAGAAVATEVSRREGRILPARREAFFDPRLLARMRLLRPRDQLEAILAFGVPRSAGREERRHRMKSVLEEVSRKMGVSASRIGLFPRLRLAIVHAPRGLIEALIDHPRVVLASAPDVSRQA